MLSISICDDCREHRNHLESLLRKYFAQKRIAVAIRQFASGEELVRFTGRTDIAFLDIEMYGINGIEAGYALTKRNNDVIIFIITSYNSYLDDAMDLKVFRYLSKPVDAERLFSALDILAERSKEISFYSNHVSVTLKVRDIAVIFSDSRKTVVITSSGEKYPTTNSIKEWLELLDGNDIFSHPHYSYIINLRYVAGITGKIITVRLNNGITMEIEASQRKLADFKNDIIRISRRGI
ncbi:MAG: LytR/AlgR family response regulator transcription factor [Ruminococcus sp.]